MKIKSIVKILIMVLICSMVISSLSYVYGASTMQAVTAMDEMGSKTITDSSGGKLGGIINAVIGFVQIAGTGISMIMVTVLGIRYIMAAPSDKADVKKQIAPMGVGAIVLFGSVNLVNIVAKIAMSTLDSAAQSVN